MPRHLVGIRRAPRHSTQKKDRHARAWSRPSPSADPCVVHRCASSTGRRASKPPKGRTCRCSPRRMCRRKHGPIPSMPRSLGTDPLRAGVDEAIDSVESRYEEHSAYRAKASSEAIRFDKSPTGDDCSRSRYAVPARLRCDGATNPRPGFRGNDGTTAPCEHDQDIEPS
jgi:hypothetical protein